MDAKYLAEIKAREQAATPGPWVVRENKSFGVQSENKNIACCFRQENENFIAHARTDIPALLAEVERLTAENEKMKPFYKISDDAFKHWGNAAYAMRDEERRRANAKDQQIATLEKALEIASAEVNVVFETLESHHVITRTQKGSIQENIDTWIQKAEQAQEQEGKE